MSHILAAVDFSDLADPVIQQAEHLARALDCPVTLIHVAPANPEFIGYEAGPQTVRDARAKELRAEHADLNQRAAQLKERGVDANSLFIEGASVETILQKSQQLEADFIVIGSHGHGPIYEVLVGSVCEGVVRKSTCPVLVVPPGRVEASP